MNRFIGTPCPGCGHRLDARSDYVDNAALCAQCGATLEIDAGGWVRIIAPAELQKIDAQIRRAIRAVPLHTVCQTKPPVLH